MVVIFSRVASAAPHHPSSHPNPHSQTLLLEYLLSLVHGPHPSRIAACRAYVAATRPPATPADATWHRSRYTAPAVNTAALFQSPPLKL